MNATHIHLALNHAPVLGALIGLALLLAAMARKSGELKKASFCLFVLAAVLAIPVYLTGEPAEKQVEQIAGVSEAAIERHEEAALVSLIGIEVLGLAALGGLLLSIRQPSPPNWVVIASLVFGLIAGGLLVRTANLGGQIRHTEIANPGNAASPLPSGTGGDHGD